MTENKKNVKLSSLYDLKNYLDKSKIDLFDFLKYLRYKYISKEIKNNKTNYILVKRLDNGLLNSLLKLKAKKTYENIIKKNNLNWSNLDFHLKYRAKTNNDLSLIVKNKNLKSVIETGYNLSILPLNLVINNKDLLNKFIPKLDFFESHFSKYKDPYGIFIKKSRVYYDKQYIASQKYKRTLLMNITSVCPIGCVGCYKGEFTRIKNTKFYTNLAISVSKQVSGLVNYLNNHKEIKSVIISGGEPLLLQNNGIKKILNTIKKSKYLVELRICTGMIFQGLPFRINNELINLFLDFEKTTGIKLHVNAHLSHYSQITPEAIFAVNKLVRNGFSVNSQVPLQRDVNIFQNDYDKTINGLFKLAELQAMFGIKPYKYILHMNSGSLEYSVSLEFILKLIGDLKFRLDHPLPETWQPVSISILYKGGNILLSPQLLFLISKKIIKNSNTVLYKIPVPLDNKNWKIINYFEPIIIGVNDNPNSLKIINNRYSKFLKNSKANEERVFAI